MKTRYPKHEYRNVLETQMKNEKKGINPKMKTNLISFLSRVSGSYDAFFWALATLIDVSYSSCLQVVATLKMASSILSRISNKISMKYCLRNIGIESSWYCLLLFGVMYSCNCIHCGGGGPGQIGPQHSRYWGCGQQHLGRLCFGWDYKDPDLIAQINAPKIWI